jgi:CHAD domain-containing protein
VHHAAGKIPGVGGGRRDRDALQLRLDIIIMELPPQETARRARTTTTRERTKAEDLRIDTSKQAVKGKR